MARLGYGSTFGFLIGVVSVVLVAAFVYKSVDSVMQLRPEPPADFLGVNATWSTKQRAAEERLARAYWEAARKLSGTVHAFGTRLPDEPPGAFSVDAKSYPSLVEPGPVARERYWRNLQKVWNDPEAWKYSYEWHTSWFFQGMNY
jgi:hypothetical protein